MELSKEQEEKTITLVWNGGRSFSILFFLLLFPPSSPLLLLSAQVKSLTPSSSVFLGVQGDLYPFFGGDGGLANLVSISPVPLVPVLSH